ncbi:MAG: hypothetical protein ABIJ21_04515 [Nanoarchaeota archaeon]
MKNETDLRELINSALKEQGLALQHISKGNSGYRLIFEKEPTFHLLDEAAHRVAKATKTTYQIAERYLGGPWHYIFSFWKA